MKIHLYKSKFAITIILLTLLFSTSESFAQIALRSSSTLTSNTSTVAIPRPTGLAVGDLMLANIVQSENNANATLSNATATEWTLVTGIEIASAGNNSVWGTILYKVATATDVSAANFTFSGDIDADDIEGGIAAFSGVAVTGGVSGGPFDVAPGIISTGNSDDLNATSIITATIDAAVVMFGMVADNEEISSWTATSPSPLGEIFDVPFNAAVDISMGMAWAIKTAAGTTGAGTGECVNNDDDLHGSILLALRACKVTANAGTALTAICQGGTSAALGGSVGGFATGGTWSSNVAGGTFTPNASSLDATWTPPTSFAGIATLTVTTTGGACGSATASKTLLVSPIPTAVTAAASETAICTGGTVSLTSSATSNSSTATTLINQNFNSAPTGWTTTNTSTGGTPANAAWTLRPSGYLYDQYTPVYTFTSNDNTQFYLSNSAQQGVAGAVTATTLQSPTFSTVGLNAAALSFYHFYEDYDATDSAIVEISINNGSSWTVLNTYTTDQGTQSAFALVTTSLASYLGQPTVSIRFRYNAIWSWFWAVDNVSVTGTLASSVPPTYAWTSTPSGYVSSTQNPTGVAPTITTTYTVTATNSFGCTASATTATVTVAANMTTTAASSTPSLCLGAVLPTITHNTTGATGIDQDGISGANGLPLGVSASYAANVITISGTPTEAGKFFYSISLIGGCGSINARGTITVGSLLTTAGETICQGSNSVTGLTTSGCINLSGYLIYPDLGIAFGTGTEWQSPGNIGANDGPTATAAIVSNGTTVTGTSQTLRATDFGFSIPENATITGIKVIVGHKASVNTATNFVKDNAIQLIVGGSLTGNNLANVSNNWNTIEVASNYGSNISNEWGTPLTPAILNASDFGVGLVIDLSANGSPAITSADVDYIKMSVYYSTPGTINWYDASSGGTLVGTGSPFNPTSSLPGGTTNTPGVYTFWAECADYSIGCRTSADFVVTSQNTWTGATSTAWETATNWSCGSLPTATTDVIIGTSSNNPVISSDVSINSLTVNSGETVKVNSGFNLRVGNAIVNNGTLTIENNANLIQTALTNTNSGSGSAVVKRNSNPLYRQDYTMWSSPVSGTQTLLNFSPATLSTRFYTYDHTIGTATGGYRLVTNPSTTPFATGTGYLIRMPDTGSANYNAGTETLTFPGTFTGTPNNGTITLSPLATGEFYSIGNPYPSPINANTFITDNSIGNTLIPGDGLYFWRKTNNPDAPTYATYTTAGGVKSPGDPLNIIPSSTIQVGQGFIVKATLASLVFNNLQRTGNNDNQFLRTTTIERHRIWLTLSNATTSFNQMMVAYMTGATQGIDAGIEGRYFNDTPTALNSLLNNEEFAIQGRSLPFNASDVVPLAFKVAVAGNYTIAIDHVDGLFTDGAQAIYLKDNLNNTVHNLTAGAYTFASAVGTFNNRFEVVYQSALDTDNPTFTANQVVIYKNEVNDFVINSGTAIMASVKVFDIRGRLLLERNNINATQTTITAGNSNEVLLVQITSQDGLVVTKKVVR